MFIRNTFINAFKEILLTSEKQYIVIVGSYGVGKTHLLRFLQEEAAIDGSTTIALDPFANDLAQQLSSLPEGTATIIFDSEHGVDSIYIRSFIESYQYNYRYIFTAEGAIDDDRVENFILPFVSFREYSEDNALTIQMRDVLSGTADMTAINHLKDAYIHLGHSPRHISRPETIHDDFLTICTDIESELFDKEHIQFMEFFRTLAMETGTCFKADKLAKLLGITRRKVNKYMEILLRKGIVRAIGPWVQDPETETSRHVKIYFNDLSLLASLLGENYYQGALKLGALENFIYLELERKLTSTHDLFYYRKKSGSEITFILEERASKKITPIEVVSRDLATISQALKSFDNEYHDRVERYMIMNDSLALKKDLKGIPLFTLPHATI